MQLILVCFVDERV